MSRKRSSSLNDAFRRRNSLPRESGRMSATEMGAGLVKAIRCGDDAWLSSLLAAGAPPNARDEGGRPVLYLLLEASGSPDVCKMLLEKGALPDLPVPGTGQTALHAAARKGFQVCIGQLLSESANPDQPDHLGNSPLMYACANGHDPSARMLIKAGAFAGRVNCRGETGLHLAAKQGSLGCVKELLAASCPVNCPDERGLTPLLIASITNQPSVIHLLLDHGCSVHDQDPQTGRTALHWAVLHRDQSTVTKLLLSGIDSNLRDVYWNTAFLIAANQGDRQMTRLLVEAGCDVAVTDKSFSTALHLCSRDGHAELIPIFVESGLNLDLKGPGGLTPLMLGAHGGHERVVRTLLGYGARPNLLDRNRASALVYAMLSNASQECIGNIVKCLIQFNVDLDESANLVGLSRGVSLPPELAKAALEDRLYSPIEIAYLLGSSFLCGILVRAGADLSVISVPRGSARAGGRSPTAVSRDLLQRLLQHARRQRKVVPSLVVLCRRPVLRRIAEFISLARLEELGLPEDVVRFLRYDDLDAAPRLKSAAVPAMIPTTEPVGRTNNGTRWNQSRNALAEPAGTSLGTQKNKSKVNLVEYATEQTGTSSGTQKTKSRANLVEYATEQTGTQKSKSRANLVEYAREPIGTSTGNPKSKSRINLVEYATEPGGTPQGVRLRNRIEPASEPAVRPSVTRWNQAFDRNDPRRRTVAEVPRSGTGNSRLNLHRKPQTGVADFSPEQKNLQVNHQNSTGTSTSGSSGSATPRSFFSRESTLRSTMTTTTRSRPSEFATRAIAPASATNGTLRTTRAKSSSNLSRTRHPVARESGWNSINLDRTKSELRIAATTPWR